MGGLMAVIPASEVDTDGWEGSFTQAASCVVDGWWSINKIHIILMVCFVCHSLTFFFSLKKAS